MTNSDGVIMDTVEIQNINNQIVQDTDLTPVQQFYNNANVLVTGATGFLGHILIEKLLRSCPGLSTLYLLVRNKKGKNLTTRVDEIFDDPVFNRLKGECPKFRHKIVGVGGDCSLPDLGLSEQDRQILINEIDIVFHVAATVRFDEKLKVAVAINVRAPQDILRLAQQMPNLKSFLHVSTAYSNCINQVVEERIYPTTMDYKKLILITENLPDKILDGITPVILENYPNTYAFTKQVAESVVQHEGAGMPIGILRPAIVVSTYKEPIKGWINNVYGATGICLGAGVGVLRVTHCDPDCNANIVPVDMCVNSMIAAAWEIGTTFEKVKKTKENFEIPVYNFESSSDNPINWRRFMALSYQYGINGPSVHALWYYSLTLQKSLTLYIITRFLVHTIPAFLMDTALVCMGKSPRMLKVYSKIHRFGRVTSYFSNREWTFKSHNVQGLVAKMTPRDNEIFFSDLKRLEWDEFFGTYLLGVRLYLLKDPIETLEAARRKWNRLRWAHQIVKAVIGLLLVKILWSIFSLIYNFIY